MNKVHYTACPVCNNSDINPLLTVKDHSVSGEDFVIWQCSACLLRFTQDVPDETAISRYYQSEDYISHSNTDKGLINKLYQKVRGITLQQKRDLVVKSTGVAAGSLLDVGAGVGAFLDVMKRSGWNTTGIEPDDAARAIAQKTYGIHLSKSYVLDELPRQSFDAITLWHVLEHVHQLHPYIEKLKSLLKDSGKLFIAVPNYSSLDSAVYKLYWAAYDVPRHLYHFSPRSIEVLMRQHGLKVSAKKPMLFDAFYISLLSSKYKNGASNWLGAGIAGLRSNINAMGNTERCSSIVYIVEKA